MSKELEIDEDGRFNIRTKYTTSLVVNNGYRCCCYNSWSYEAEGHKTLEEAVAKYLKPNQIPEVEKITDSQIEKVEIYEVEVWEEVDEDGDVWEHEGEPQIMAWGYLTWPRIFGGRGNGYKGSMWSGHDGEHDFCVTSGVPEGMSWDEFCADLQRQQDERRKKEKSW